MARTPAYLELVDRFPHTSLVASGEQVGLPAGQMGNSEVGHMNLGAGRIVYQDLTRIDRSILDGEFFENPVLSAALDRCQHDAHAVHFVGLLSDGGVHSHEKHLHALIEMAARRKLERVFVQVLTDGRDTSPNGGLGYIGELQRVMGRLGTGRVASVGGRYFAMDRDKRWERTRRGYDAVMGRQGGRSDDPVASVRASYEAGVTDEFVEPTIIEDAAGSPVGPVREGDSVIFFNFRADRMRQLTRAIAFAKFDGFDRGDRPEVLAVTMTEYEARFGLPVAFTPAKFSGNLAEELTKSGLTNLRLAETEKYAHVTYFFNCGEERPYTGEDRILVPSPKVATYDLQPEMSAEGITDQFVASVESRRHDVIVCNFANADMVGHTGSLEAAVRAVETLDRCIARIVTAMRASGGTVILTADHGNAEQMWDPVTNGPHTAHTSNPVPVILVGDHPSLRLRDGGSLRDVAPTMMGLLGIDPPKEMTGGDLRVI